MGAAQQTPYKREDDSPAGEGATGEADQVQAFSDANVLSLKMLQLPISDARKAPTTGLVGGVVDADSSVPVADKSQTLL